MQRIIIVLLSPKLFYRDLAWASASDSFSVFSLSSTAVLRQHLLPGVARCCSFRVFFLTIEFPMAGFWTFKSQLKICLLRASIYLYQTNSFYFIDSRAVMSNLLEPSVIAACCLPHSAVGLPTLLWGLTIWNAVLSSPSFCRMCHGNWYLGYIWYMVGNQYLLNTNLNRCLDVSF